LFNKNQSEWCHTAQSCLGSPPPKGFLLLAWPKSNKSPRLASFLVKTYGNLYCSSIEAVSPLLFHRSRFDPALGCGVMIEGGKDFRAFSYENLPGRRQGADSKEHIASCGSVIYIGFPTLSPIVWKHL